MEEKWQLLEAVYGPEGVMYTQVESPERYAKLIAKIDNDEHTIYGKGYVLGIIRDFHGSPIVCCTLTGDDETLKHFEQLQAKVERLKVA